MDTRFVRSLSAVAAALTWLLGARVALSEPAALSLASAGLAWDAKVKEYNARPGESSHLFAFSVTNTSAQEVTVTAVQPGCSCTVLELPHLPWKLAPGETGRFQANVDWTGQYGVFSRNIYVDTANAANTETLTVRIDIPPPSGLVTLPLDRARNLQVAMADRQAVFRDRCATCHVVPATGKTGQELYTAACSICHEATRRAKMVPDLMASKPPTDTAYWRQWIAHGKTGSLMPAFAQSEGGPLTEPQIASLVEYLTTIASKRIAPPQPSAATN